jgi:hypothetical protein
MNSGMVGPKSQRMARRSKKGPVSLMSLRASEVVRTVVDHPSRLDELLTLLQDRGRLVRARAATTLARLSESHPRRLVRVIDRLKESLSDESAYVRWHLVYSLGCVGCSISPTVPGLLADLIGRLDDENGVVRAMASQAVAKLALRKTRLVVEFFKTHNRELPASLSKAIARIEAKIANSGA